MRRIVARARGRVAAAALFAAACLAPSWAAPPTARACNACVEDKVAATYDWQVVSAAKARGHTIVFTAIRGTVAPGDSALARKLARQIGGVAGVDAGTPRISLAPPAASFAFDPARHSVTQLLAAINARLKSSGLSLSVVRVGAPGAAAPVAVVAR
jgi:hypothetical protein